MLKSFKRRYKLYRQTATLNKIQNMSVTQASERDMIDAAQRLHAKIYLRRKYVTPDDISEDGRLNETADPYTNQSKYFVLTNQLNKHPRVLATARQIHNVAGKGHDSFPTVKQLKLYPEMEQAIRAIDPSKCVEISALAKDHGVDPRGTMMLYRTMWHHSLRNGHRIWLMACDAKVFDHLKSLFGESFTRIGDNTYYMGSEVVPAMLEVHKSIGTLIQQSKSLNPFKRRLKLMLINFFTDGLPIDSAETVSKKSRVSGQLVSRVRTQKL